MKKSLSKAPAEPGFFRIQYGNANYTRDIDVHEDMNIREIFEKIESSTKRKIKFWIVKKSDQTHTGSQQLGVTSTLIPKYIVAQKFFYKNSKMKIDQHTKKL